MTFCQKHQDAQIEMKRRQRQFLSSSHVIVGDPPSKRAKKEAIDLNSCYSTSDDRILNIHATHVSINSQYGASRGKRQKCEIIESEDNKKQREHLAKMNNNGGKMIRALHGIKLKEIDTSSAFSAEALRKIGFNPATKQDYIYRGKKDAVSEVKDVLPVVKDVVLEVKEIEPEMIYFSDDE